MCYVIPTHSSLQVDQISGKIEGQFLIPHARSDPRDLTQLHTKTKVDAGPDLMNPTYRFEYDGPEGNGSWREIQPLSLTGENVIYFFLNCLFRNEFEILAFLLKVLRSHAEAN